MALIESEDKMQATQPAIETEQAVAPADMLINQQPSTSTLPVGAGVSIPNLETESPELVIQDPEMPIGAKMAAMADLERQDAQEAQLQQEAQAEKYRKFQKWTQGVQAMKNYNQAAARRGLKPEPLPEPEKFGLTMEEVDRFSDMAKNEKIVEIAEKQEIKDAINKGIEEGQREGAAESARLEALNRELANAARVEKMRLDLAQKELDDEQNQLSEIDPNRFWKNKSTWDKVLAGIAILGGSVGAALQGKGAENQALKVIMDAIDKDIDAQKVSNEQKMKLKQNALKRAELEIARFEAESKDAARRDQFALARQKLQSDIADISAQNLQNKKLAAAMSSPEGMSPIEARQLSLQNPKLGELQIPLPNGNVGFARSKDAAEKFNSAITETDSATTMLEGIINRIEQIGPTAVQFTPGVLDDRVKSISGDLAALVGKLRVPITGPGVLTEPDVERIKSAMGDPTKLLAKPGQAFKQMKELNTLLRLEKEMIYKNTIPGYQLRGEDAARIKLWKAGWDMDKIDKYVKQRFGK